MLSTPIIQAGAVVFSLLAFSALIVMRLRSGKRPTNLRKLIAPPLGMSTGFIMFVFPEVHIPWSWGLSAFGTGLLIFSFPLVVTTRLERVKSDIYVRQSKAFIAILVVLFSIRLSLHTVVEQYMSIFQTGALFYLVAFGMIIPWRLAMVSDYVRLQKVQN